MTEFNVTRRQFSLVGMAAMAAPMIGAPLVARAAAPDFAGRTINFYTSHQAADSVLSLQTWSNYIARYLPGQPTIAVVTKFGGGGLTNANFFAASAKPDGLSAAMMNGVAQFSSPMKLPAVDYDMSAFKVLGAESQTYIHLAGTSSPLGPDNLDLAAVPQQTYGTRPRNVNVMAAELVFAAAGNPARVVTGFGESEAVIQALANGELNLSYIFTNSWVRNAENYKSLGIKPLFQMGSMDPKGEVIRAKELPDLPTALELFLKYAPNATESLEYGAVKIGSGLAQTSKTFVLAEGTPDEIVAVWRDAADKAATDPAFVEEHTKLLGKPLDYVPSAEAEAIIRANAEVLSTPFFQQGGQGYAMMLGQ